MPIRHPNTEMSSNRENLSEQLMLAEAGYQAARSRSDWDKAQALAMMMMNLCRRLDLIDMETLALKEWNQAT